MNIAYHASATLGSISSGTLIPADIINACAPVLERLAKARDMLGHMTLAGLALDCVKLDADADTLERLLGEVFDALDAYAPDYAYFGAHPGDGADFGFWLAEDFQQQFQDDGGLEVDNLSKVPDDYAGMIMVINDHGNATLYARDVTGQTRTIWSVI